MNETASMAAFDHQQRGGIRQELLGYMRAHKVGVPTLCKRIMDADPRRRELPLSTLQRFLKDAHRTMDSYVGLCAQFLETVEKETAGEGGELGAALAGFVAADEQAELSDDLRTVLAGEYRQVMSREAEAADGPTAIEIASVPGRAFMQVNETRTSPGGGRVRHRFEGALAPSGLVVFAVLRSVLTHLPKVYWLERIETAEGFADRYLIGQASETLFREETPEGDCVTNTMIMLQAES